MGETVEIKDLVILGRSSPDMMKDGRMSVCVAGYSRQHGFIRLYPTRVDSPLKTWNVVEVPVERNDQDHRFESWKIEGSKSEWPSLSNRIKVIGYVPREDRLDLLRSHIDGCVMDINDQRRSLGLVSPSFRKCYFEDRADYDSSFQLTLFGRVLMSDKHKYGLQPRVRYRCSGCRAADSHDQQILEWGVYEWFRKHPDGPEKVWDNLFSREAKQQILFLVGNLARHPSSFMVISILRIPLPSHSRQITYFEPKARHP
jgi:hypothetical protein